MVISTKMTGEEKKKNMKRRIFVCIAGGLSRRIMGSCVHSAVSSDLTTVTSNVITCMNASRRVAIGSRVREGATWSTTSTGSTESATEPKAKRWRPHGSMVIQNKRGPVASALVPSQHFQNV